MRGLFRRSAMMYRMESEEKKATIWERKAIAFSACLGRISLILTGSDLIQTMLWWISLLHLCSARASSLSIRNLYLRIFLAFSFFLSLSLSLSLPFLSPYICAPLSETYLVLLCLFSIHIATILEYFSLFLLLRRVRYINIDIYICTWTELVTSNDWMATSSSYNNSIQRY